MKSSLRRGCVAALSLFALQACGPADPKPFSLQFAALSDGKKVSCTDELQDFGTGASKSTVGINDLRFYVSNLRFLNKDGEALETTLDTNEFQYSSADGSVAMVDLTGNTEGSCAASAMSDSEGTARTHLAITGTTPVDDVKTVAFDVGVPQPLMKKTIATTSAEAAPSPMNEMYWSWNSGYRHFVFNFVVKTGATSGGGFAHVGSRDCGPQGGLALSDRDSCTYVNTPSVSLAKFDLEKDFVGIDLRKVLADLDFVAPIYDMATMQQIGEGPGVACHSSPMQPDCVTMFPHFGLDMTSGAATASSNAVFVKAR